jgi:hypothetical protein
MANDDTPTAAASGLQQRPLIVLSLKFDRAANSA